MGTVPFDGLCGAAGPMAVTNMSGTLFTWLAASATEQFWRSTGFANPCEHVCSMATREPGEASRLKKRRCGAQRLALMAAAAAAPQPPPKRWWWYCQPRGWASSQSRPQPLPLSGGPWREVAATLNCPLLPAMHALTGRDVPLRVPQVWHGVCKPAASRKAVDFREAARCRLLRVDRLNAAGWHHAERTAPVAGSPRRSKGCRGAAPSTPAVQVLLGDPLRGRTL